MTDPKAEPRRCNICGLSDATGTLILDFVTYYGHKSAALCRNELLRQRDAAVEALRALVEIKDESQIPAVYEMARAVIANIEKGA